ncbi:hypothetical protein HAX54_016561 [Datura stramonium]|uniref:Uncharacterized protein n=1 Tax=Datura stramonium TaxID=4076 RepID=A0ABS8UJ41_DATST|nr:hypothetical protein [Datura stramonium]
MVSTFHDRIYVSELDPTPTLIRCHCRVLARNQITNLGSRLRSELGLESASDIELWLGSLSIPELMLDHSHVEDQVLRLGRVQVWCRISSQGHVSSQYWDHVGSRVVVGIGV